MYKALFVLFGFFCNQSIAAEENESNAPRIIPVIVQDIKPAKYQEWGTYYGELTGTKQETLITEAPGRVGGIMVKEGDTVKRDTPMCEIESQKYKIVYETAQLATKISKKQWERAKLHMKSGSASKMQADQANLNWLESEAKLLDAQKIYQASACIAPFDGVAVGVHPNLYQHLPTGSPTITVAQLDNMQLEVGVPESVVTGYKVGAKALLEHKAYPGKKWPGKIESISQIVDQNRKTFNLTIHVNNPDHLLKPGHTIKVNILRFDLDNQIVIPSKAIITKTNRRVVMVVNENSKAVEIEVSIKNENKGLALIEKGLKIGDRLIVKGQHQTVTGSPVNMKHQGS